MVPGKVYSPRDVLEAAWRRRWHIGLPLVVISVASLLWALSLPYRYQSVATIQVLPPVAPDSMVRTTVQTRIEDRLPSIGQQVMTRDRLERIVERFDLYAKMRQTTVMESVIDQMRRDIAFRVVDRDVFELGFASRDPRVALEVARSLTDLFIEQTARDREGMADKTTGFIESQLADAAGRLAEQERRVQEFQQRNAGQLPTQYDANVQMLNSTQAQLQTLTESINRDRDQRLLLQRQLDDAAGGSTTPGGSDDAVASGVDGTDRAQMLAQIEAARGELRDLRMRLTPQHPDVQRAERAIARLETQLQAAPADPAGPRILSSAAVAQAARARDLRDQLALLDRQIATKQTDERRLRGTIAQYRQRVEATPLQEAEYASLTRDLEALQKLYASLAQKKEDAQIAANLEHADVGERFKMLEPARLPEKPLSPSRRRAFFLGVLAAVLFGVSLGALAEFRDTSLRTDDDVAASLGLPVLAMVPALDVGPAGATLSRAGVVLTVAITLACVGLAVMLGMAF